MDRSVEKENSAFDVAAVEVHFENVVNNLGRKTLVSVRALKCNIPLGLPSASFEACFLG